jgi:hypothetical protein
MALKLVVSNAQASEESEALQRLHRGDITLEEYLDIKADEAVEHLRGKKSAEHIAAVRHAVRMQMVLHPVTVELARRVTGQDPQRLPRGARR